MNNPLQRFEDSIKACLPVASGLFFLILMIVPWPSHTIKAILSAFPLMVLCFWIINRPEYFAMTWSFMIGFAQDVILGQPLGVTALIYLAVDFFLRGQRQFFLQQSFHHLWLVFSLVMASVSMAQWLVASLVTHAWIELAPILLRMVIGILFFPMMTMALHHLQRSVFSRT